MYVLVDGGRGLQGRRNTHFFIICLIKFANIKPIAKTIPPLWSLKTIEKPIGKSANALKL